MATFFAKQALDIAKNQLIDYAKDYLISQIQDKLNQGDEGIKALFDELKKKLINSTFLKTILGAICINPELVEKVKTELKEQIEKINFTEELEKMPEKMPEEMPEEIKNKIITLSKTLKEQLNKLIDEIITCNAPTTTVVEPAPATLGGYKQRDRKKKRRQKTKKRIYKKSRGRRQYSRK